MNVFPYYHFDNKTTKYLKSIKYFILKYRMIFFKRGVTLSFPKSVTPQAISKVFSQKVYTSSLVSKNI